MGFWSNLVAAAQQVGNAIVETATNAYNAVSQWLTGKPDVPVPAAPTTGAGSLSTDTISSVAAPPPRPATPSTPTENLTTADTPPSRSEDLNNPTADAENAADEEAKDEDPECTTGCCGKGAPTDADYEKVAAKLEMEMCVVKAVAKVESRGNGFDNNCRAKILYERHWFSKLTNRQYDNDRFISAKQTFKRGSKDKNEYYGGWSRERFDKAKALNEDAAIQATSWGAFQIMGFNYEDAGFNSPKEMMNAMEESTEKQVESFITFISNYRKGAAKNAMKNRDWAKVAEIYNGSDYKKTNMTPKWKMSIIYAKNLNDLSC